MTRLYYPLTFIAVPVVCIVLHRPLLPHLALAWGGCAFWWVGLLMYLPWPKGSPEAWKAAIEAAPPPPVVVRKSLAAVALGSLVVALWGLP